MAKSPFLTSQPNRNRLFNLFDKTERIWQKIERYIETSQYEQVRLLLEKLPSSERNTARYYKTLTKTILKTYLVY